MDTLIEGGPPVATVTVVLLVTSPKVAVKLLEVELEELNCPAVPLVFETVTLELELTKEVS
jgi:hypothetical protein